MSSVEAGFEPDKLSGGDESDAFINEVLSTKGEQEATSQPGYEQEVGEITTVKLMMARRRSA